MGKTVKDKELKVEAIRCATGLHCSPVANGVVKDRKPADVVNTAKLIYAWLKD